MKRIFFILITLSFYTSSVAFAQESKKMTRKEREEAWRAERLKKKEAEKARIEMQDSLDFMQALHAIQNGSWALEASSITFNNGYSEYVTPSTNFVSINVSILNIS